MSLAMFRTKTHLFWVWLLMLPAAAIAGPVEDYERGFEAYKNEDLITAMGWLRKSADAGHTPAEVLLAYILDKSEENAEALTLYQRAAEKGDPEGQLGLADMYAAGDGVDQDFQMALVWYTRAAEGGSTRAARVLATAYLKGGLGLEADREQAIAWLNHGAALGDSAAERELRQLTQNANDSNSPAPQ